MKKLKIWKLDKGIIKAIFRSGETLELLVNYFNEQKELKPYQKLSRLLKERLMSYYQGALSNNQ